MQLLPKIQIDWVIFNFTCVETEKWLERKNEKREKDKRKKNRKKKRKTQTEKETQIKKKQRRME